MADSSPSPSRRSSPRTTSCQRCGRTWASLKQGHCTRCHRHFSSPTAFDAHQTCADGRTVVCHDPADRGLVVRDDKYGAVWRIPADPAFLERIAALGDS